MTHNDHLCIYLVAEIARHSTSNSIMVSVEIGDSSGQCMPEVWQDCSPLISTGNGDNDGV